VSLAMRQSSPSQRSKSEVVRDQSQKSSEIKVRSRRYVKCYSFEFIVTCIISGRARPEIVLITLVNSLITHSLQVGVGSALVAFCVGTYVLSKYASGTTFSAT